ncbi:ABCA9 protein, partial [Semnornis frantzii]|nr:ABCA9 protein [Semnornis frantzii]
GLFFPSRLLFFGVFIFPTLMTFTGFELWGGSTSWEITASSYFVPTKENSESKSTNLLILNDTGSHIENFLAALEAQNIIPEITHEKNFTSIPLYYGALKVALEGKV